MDLVAITGHFVWMVEIAMSVNYASCTCIFLQTNSGTNHDQGWQDVVKFLGCDRQWWILCSFPGLHRNCSEPEKVCWKFRLWLVSMSYLLNKQQLSLGFSGSLLPRPSCDTLREGGMGQEKLTIVFNASASSLHIYMGLALNFRLMYLILINRFITH